MARPRIKNAWNFDSAARQVDTGDFDFILDEDTDVGYAFAQVVDAAIEAGLAGFTENFIAENDLLTSAQADLLYELVGAVLAHVGELDPHTQYATEAALSATLANYSTTAQADLLYEAIGAAAAAIAAHNAVLDPHPQYTTDAEVSSAISSALGAAAFARDAEVITTASLADQAVEDGTVALAAGYRLLGFECDRACRVRLYTTSTARTNDAARLVGVDVDIATDHGLVFEFVAEAAVDVNLSPLVDGICPTGTTVYYAIQNLSGSAAAVEVTLDWIRTE